MSLLDFEAWASCLALLFAGTAVFAQTAGAPLTLEQAISLARIRNPSLLSGQQHVIATKANEITAGLRQNPNFTFSGSDISLPADNPASPYSYAANVSRLFERGQKRRWRLDIAQATPTLPGANIAIPSDRPSLQVKEAFTNMLTAKAATQDRRR